MLYTIPDYYKEFTCIADKCQDTCCAGWQIVVDKKSLLKYKEICGNLVLARNKDKTMEPQDAMLGWKMLRFIHWSEGTFRQDSDKRCAFLDNHNLCDLYKNLGEKSLCKTCRLYPRHIEEFEGLREITLSVSCPEVARILMERKTPVTFLTYEKEGDEEYEDFDPFLFSILEDARKEMIQILQNRNLTIRERTAFILGMAHDMQVRINRQEMFECSEVIEKYKKEEALKYVRKYLKQLALEPDSRETGEKTKMILNKELFEKLFELEVLREEWTGLLQETNRVLFAAGPDNYDRICHTFADWKKQNPDIDIHLEQLLVYFLFTYFPGAVYDGDVYAKVQMSVSCVWMMENLWMARWHRNEEKLDFHEMIELVYRFSREVEHSDENLKQVEKWMEKKWFLRSA